MQRILTAAIFDNDNFLTRPGRPYHPDVRRELEALFREFQNAVIGTSSGKPAEFQRRVYWDDFAPDVLERTVIIGNNGAEALVGLSPDREPLLRLVYDVEANNAGQAVRQLNLVADKVVRHYGPLVYEQQNAVDNKGRELMRTIFPVTVQNSQMLMKYMDASGELHFGIGINPSSQQLIEMGIDPLEVPTPAEIFAKAQDFMGAAVFEGDGMIYALLHDDAAELMPEGMHKAYMMRHVAECLGIPQVGMTTYVDALDCCANPEDGIPIDKETGLQTLNGSLELPPVSVESAYEIVSRTEPRDDLTEKVYLETMKVPHLEKTGGGNLLNIVAGGDGDNDVPALKAAVVSIAPRRSPESVTRYATHLVGPGAGIKRHDLVDKTALQVLAASRVCLRVTSRIGW